MKPIFQTRFGGADSAEEDQGDCMAACLASIFEVGLDEVPDFTGSITSGGWFFHLQTWLKKRNLSLLMLPKDAKDIPMGYAMAAVLSHTLENPKDGHMIVVRDGRLAHDPNPNNSDKKEEDYTITGYWAFTCVNPALGVFNGD